MKPKPKLEPNVSFQHVDRYRPGETQALGKSAAVTSADQKVPDVLEIWVEQPLDPQWVAAFRLVRRGGASTRFRVGELRIFPAEVGRRPGEWSGAWRGIEAEAPRRGLTTKILKRAQPHLWLQFMEKLVPQFRALFPGEEFEPPLVSSRSPTERRGRPKLSDEFLALVAQQYAEASATGKRPVEAVAQKHGEVVAKVRGWIHKARLRGFLTKGAQGKTGGQLTSKATFILESQKQSKRVRAPQRRAKRRRK